MFFTGCLKKWPLLRDNLGGLGRAVVAVAVVERFEQKRLYGLFTRAKEVAVVERRPSVRFEYIFHN